MRILIYLHFSEKRNETSNGAETIAKKVLNTLRDL